MSSPGLRQRRKELMQCSPKVCAGRWSSVVAAVAQMLRVEEVLKQAWCKDSFLNGRPGAPRAVSYTHLRAHETSAHL
eukprot:9428991-Alexandrium_andersonii.AAC.1